MSSDKYKELKNSIEDSMLWDEYDIDTRNELAIQEFLHLSRTS